MVSDVASPSMCRQTREPFALVREDHESMPHREGLISSITLKVIHYMRSKESFSTVVPTNPLRGGVAIPTAWSKSEAMFGQLKHSPRGRTS